MFPENISTPSWDLTPYSDLRRNLRPESCLFVAFLHASRSLASQPTVTFAPLNLYAIHFNQDLKIETTFKPDSWKVTAKKGDTIAVHYVRGAFRFVGEFLLISDTLDRPRSLLTVGGQTGTLVTDGTKFDSRSVVLDVAINHRLLLALIPAALCIQLGSQRSSRIRTYVNGYLSILVTNNGFCYSLAVGAGRVIKGLCDLPLCH